MTLLTKTPDLAGFEGLAWSEEVGRKTKLVLEALNVAPCRKKGDCIQNIAQKYNLSRPTVYRLLKQYKENGASGFAPIRSTRGVARSWSNEALDFWIGLVLKREHRKISKKGLYGILENEATKKGWKIGSYPNACKKISEHITPQLLALQKGGVRELDNSLPPVLRSYADLQPFEIIVGDQHRFDFWVLDPHTGEVFRPEGYLWQDLRTRAIYGAALARKYDSHLMALALRVGVYQFGLFRNIYTDNGKPELSRYIEGIVNDIKGYDLGIRETISTSVDLNSAHPEEIKCDITLPGQHHKAIVRNAKAKMVEGTFNVIEGGLRDQALFPGYVKRLSDLEERQEIDGKEVNRLAESGKLPTFEEFYRGLFAVCDWYNFEKSHRGLLREATCQPRPKSMTPMNCIENCLRQGWAPTRVPEDAIDLLFLPKEPSPRTVDRGRIRFRNNLYEHPSLTGLNGQKVRLRFDPQEPEYILVFHKTKYLCRAGTVEYSSMKDKDLAARKIKEKRHFRKKVVGQYRAITEGIPDVRQFSEVPEFERTAALIRKDKRQKAIENRELYRERTEEQLALEVAEIKTASETIQHTPRIDNEFAERPSFFLDDPTHYKWILAQVVEGRNLSQADQDFKEAYESEMDPEALRYWNKRQEFKEIGLC